MGISNRLVRNTYIVRLSSFSLFKEGQQEEGVYINRSRLARTCRLERVGSS